ncbi:Hypothetical predicted protein [Cloeon dipterum]|uniref:Uncharacterized protein n=1 Tax=Cloeon dipterum TaxID=197152 RepID=A0A8S1E8E5_9INSE|nr:Hypothetical predicted protein [Cloeon dipterum]
MVSQSKPLPHWRAWPSLDQSYLIPIPPSSSSSPLISSTGLGRIRRGSADEPIRAPMAEVARFGEPVKKASTLAEAVLNLNDQLNLKLVAGRGSEQSWKGKGAERKF